MDLMDSLCYRCFSCWGSTKDHKAKCDAYPSGECRNGIPVHKITLVDYRDSCEFFEEDDDCDEERLQWRMDKIKAKLEPSTSPNGEVRYYIDDWYRLISGILDKHSASGWTPPDSEKIKEGRVWFDVNTEIHFDGIDDRVVIKVI